MFVEKKYISKIFIFLSFFNNLFPVTVGSDYTLQDHIVFTDAQNLIDNDAKMERGFQLHETSVSCSFNSFYPVRGDVDLRGGRLYLQVDLDFTNTFLLSGGGKIFGEGYAIRFPKNYSTFITPSSLLINNTDFIFYSDVSVKYTSSFSGNCSINCNGGNLTLEDDGELTVLSGGVLTFRNLNLSGLKNKNIKCQDNTASIVLESCLLQLNQDYEFDKGSILFSSDIKITGTNKFCYTSTMTSTIDSCSSLYLSNGLTFSYAPVIPNRDLLYMSDKTSKFYLDGCSLYSTKTGIRLTRGRLFLENSVTFSTQAIALSQAICFGNKNLNDDLDIYLLPGVELQVHGILDYQNSN
ncbi:hypothetical protein ACFLYH_02320 [Candidatus Dependentiae bacterium]